MPKKLLKRRKREHEAYSAHRATLSHRGLREVSQEMLSRCETTLITLYTIYQRRQGQPSGPRHP